MNLLFTIIYWVLTILSLLSLIMVILLLIFFLKRRKAIQIAFSNTLGCGKEMCEATTPVLPIPVQTGTDYNKDVARYCGNLVYHVSNAAYSKDSLDIKNLNKELELKNIKENPVFGVVWSNKDTVYIIFRGTLRINEWMQDFTYGQEVFPSKVVNKKQVQLNFLQDVSTPPKVHMGFLEVYENLRDELITKLQEIKPRQIIVSGHSLGAGIASICGLDIIRLDCCKNTIVYNFASPRVGDKIFADLVESSGLKVYRIVNTADTIPTLPPSVAPNFDKPKNPWFYTHCGTEISFTNNMKSLVNNHIMSNYLNLFGLKTLN